MVIYVLSDPTTGAVRYVGKTSQALYLRKAEHRYNAKTSHTHLYCWWRSLNAEPVMEVLEEHGSFDALAEAEQFYITYFRSLGFKLVNHTDGGEGQLGLKHTEETKNRISESCKGLKKPGTAAAMKGDQRNFGRAMAEETKLKISRSLKARRPPRELAHNLPA